MRPPPAAPLDGMRELQPPLPQQGRAQAQGSRAPAAEEEALTPCSPGSSPGCWGLFFLGFGSPWSPSRPGAWCSTLAYDPAPQCRTLAQRIKNMSLEGLAGNEWRPRKRDAGVL